MKKLHLIEAVLAVFLVLAISGCEKSDSEEPSNGNSIELDGSSSNSRQATKPTLQEFINSVETEAEMRFFQSTGITDNTAIVDQAIGAGVGLLAKPKIKFKWHGKGGSGGCVKPLGLCLIIPIGLSQANVNLMVHQNKYILLYQANQQDNGLTSDGYLPIMEDVYVDQNITVEAGIYKANYSTDRSEYIAVGIDIKQ